MSTTTFQGLLKSLYSYEERPVDPIPEAVIEAAEDAIITGTGAVVITDNIIPAGPNWHYNTVITNPEWGTATTVPPLIHIDPIAYFHEPAHVQEVPLRAGTVNTPYFFDEDVPRLKKVKRQLKYKVGQILKLNTGAYASNENDTGISRGTSLLVNSISNWGTYEVTILEGKYKDQKFELSESEMKSSIQRNLPEWW